MVISNSRLTSPISLILRRTFRSVSKDEASPVLSGPSFETPLCGSSG
jgi:hypothetical protein